MKKSKQVSFASKGKPFYNKNEQIYSSNSKFDFDDNDENEGNNLDNHQGNQHMMPPEDVSFSTGRASMQQTQFNPANGEYGDEVNLRHGNNNQPILDDRRGGKQRQEAHREGDQGFQGEGGEGEEKTLKIIGSTFDLETLKDIAHNITISGPEIIAKCYENFLNDIEKPELHFPNKDTKSRVMEELACSLLSAINGSNIAGNDVNLKSYIQIKPTNADKKKTPIVDFEKLLKGNLFQKDLLKDLMKLMKMINDAETFASKTDQYTSTQTLLTSNEKVMALYKRVWEQIKLAVYKTLAVVAKSFKEKADTVEGTLNEDKLTRKANAITEKSTSHVKLLAERLEKSKDLAKHF